MYVEVCSGPRYCLLHDMSQGTFLAISLLMTETTLRSSIQYILKKALVWQLLSRCLYFYEGYCSSRLTLSVVSWSVFAGDTSFLKKKKKNCTFCRIWRFVGDASLNRFLRLFRSFTSCICILVHCLPYYSVSFNLTLLLDAFFF